MEHLLPRPSEPYERRLARVDFRTSATVCSLITAYVCGVHVREIVFGISNLWPETCLKWMKSGDCLPVVYGAIVKERIELY